MTPFPIPDREACLIVKPLNTDDGSSPAATVEGNASPEKSHVGGSWA